jgi:hypothetical protein
VLTAESYTCDPAATWCTAPTGGAATAPSLQDVAPLLAVKAAVHMDCGGDSGCAAQLGHVFGTWQSGTSPCRGQVCLPCSLQNSTCGQYDFQAKQYRCNWRYIECAGSRVTGIHLGEGS